MSEFKTPNRENRKIGNNLTQIHTCIPTDLFVQLKIYCASNNQLIKDIVTLALEKYIEDNK